MDSDEHAEPEWAAMPALSRPSSTASASTPPTATFTMCGARWTRSPSTSTSSSEVAASTSVVVSLPRCSLLLLQFSGLAERGRRRAETDYPDQVLDAPSPGPFLRATDDERLEAEPTADDERPDAGRTTEFVSTDGHEIGAQRVEIDRDVTDRRGGVDVHGHARRTAARHDLGHGLQCPHLVVAPLAISQAPADRCRGWREASRDGKDRCGLSSPLRARGRLRAGREPRARRSARRQRRSWGRRCGLARPRRRRCWRPPCHRS